MLLLGERGKVGAQVYFLIDETKFTAYMIAMQFDGAAGDMQRIGNFLGVPSFLDHIGNLYLFVGKTEEFCR